MRRPQISCSLRALVLSLSALVPVALPVAVAGCGGAGNIRYEPTTPRRARVPRGSVLTFEIDCIENPRAGSTCTYAGGPLPWPVLGIFRVPSKAIHRWEVYRERVRERAADEGCPGIAVRRAPPTYIDVEPVGAFCIAPDAGGTGRVPGGPGVGAMGGVSGSVTGGVMIPVTPAPPPQPVTNQPCRRDDDCLGGGHCSHGVCG